MPLPLPPTILLALASLQVVATRLLKIRERSSHGPFLLLALVLAAAMLIFERSTLQTVPVSDDTTTVWGRDSLAVAEQWVVLTFGALTGLASWAITADEQSKEGSCGDLLFLLAGLMFASCANDFLTLGLSIEVVALALRGLTRRAIASENRADLPDEYLDDRGRWLSSALLWYGIALLAYTTGTTQLNATRLTLVDAYAPGGDQTAIGAPSKLILLAAGLIIVSQFARMGMAPFHFGLGLHRSGRWLRSTGLSILAQQLAGAIVLTRLFSVAFAGFDRSLKTLVMAIVLVNFMLSVVMSFRALSPGIRSLPRWLCGLVLLQSGWLGIGFLITAWESAQPPFRTGAIQPLNETLAVLVLTQLTGLLSCGGIIWALGSLSRKDRDVEFLEDMKGLGHHSPVAAFALTTALASVVAIPWTAGFWARWLTLLAGHNLHAKSESPNFLPDAGMGLMMLTGVIATLSTARVAVRLVREAYLEAPHMRPASTQIRGSFLAAVIAAAGTLILGVAPQLVLAPLASVQPPHRIASDGKATGSGSSPLGMRFQRSP